MNKTIMMVIAVVCGVLGTIGIMVANKPETTNTVYEDIVVASKNLNVGDIFTSDVIVKKKVPKEFKDPLAIYWKDYDRLIGQKLLVKTFKGTQIQWSFLETELLREFENMIPRNSRALSISVSNTTGVSGLLQPGSHVDIIGIFTKSIEANNITPKTMIQVLLQDVTVLAAGKTISPLSSRLLGSQTARSNSYSTITVSVSVYEAEILIAAESRGTLYCILRNPMEDAGPLHLVEQSVNDALSASSLNEINEQRLKNRNVK